VATTVDLTPELERFAEECIAAGLYRDLSDVVRRSLRLLQEYEQQRREFEASILEAQAEADREGTYSVEQVVAEAREMLRARQG
jgi:antitoxin ParD1/3/4